MLARFVLAFACLLAVLLPPPVQADPVYMSSGQLCTHAAIYDASTNGSTKLVTGTATSQIYVCGFNFFAGGTATVKLVYGTGGTCGSGTTAITPGYPLIAQASVREPRASYSGLLPAPASNDLCINTNAAVAVQAIVFYAQY